MPIDTPGVTQSSFTERRHPLLYPITIASALSAVVSLKAPRQHMPSLYNFVTGITSGLAIWGLWLVSDGFGGIAFIFSSSNSLDSV
jgi:hypothetical protein